MKCTTAILDCYELEIFSSYIPVSPTIIINSKKVGSPSKMIYRTGFFSLLTVGAPMKKIFICYPI